jgi:hypothetical protein
LPPPRGMTATGCSGCVWWSDGMRWRGGAPSSPFLAGKGNSGHRHCRKLAAPAAFHATAPMAGAIDGVSRDVRARISIAILAGAAVSTSCREQDPPRKSCRRQEAGGTPALRQKYAAPAAGGGSRGRGPSFQKCLQNDARRSETANKTRRSRNACKPQLSTPAAAY